MLVQDNGEYAGFDEEEFTCRSGGKPAAIRHIKARFDKCYRQLCYEVVGMRIYFLKPHHISPS